jgi:hypothetical protein
MNRLDPVHHGLQVLRRVRSLVRHGSAWSVVASAAIAMLLGGFALDYWLRMGLLERAIVLVAFLAAMARLAWLHVVPAVRQTESDTQLALLVERQQGLNSDLVAAIQFDDLSRPQYGSRELREAVVDCTAETSRSLNYLEGFSAATLRRRGAVLALALLSVLATVLTVPGEAGAFVRRFLLGAARYPTRTVIAQVLRPGDRAAYGQPVEFEVRIEGQRPGSATVELRALSTGFRNDVRLDPDASRPGIYAGRLPRLLDSVEYTIVAGDAQTDPFTLKLIPLPIVDVQMEVRPPSYAAGKVKGGRERTRHVTAPEGATVVPILTATKPLRGAWVLLAAAAPTDDDASSSPATRPAERLQMVRRGSEMVFEPAAGNALSALSAGVRFEIQAEDEDGLAPELPVICSVQVRPDQEPRIGAAAASQYVLPTARPGVKYQAVDDYALDHLVVRRMVVRAADGSRTESPPLTLPVDGRPAKASGTFSLNLEELKVVPGDEVLVVLEAVDYRGGAAGKTARSDRIAFQVTDRQGLLQTVNELDKQMDEKLDAIIRAQLGIGD